MDISQVLVHDLHELMVDLHRATTDLVPATTALRRDARLAIRSYLGCVIVTSSDLGTPLQLTLADGPLDLAAIGSSLRVLLPAPSTPHATRGHVTFYAARTGELVDLAADLLATSDLGHGSVQINAPQPAGTLTPGLDGLAEFRTAHRAVGVLIAQGHSDADARSRLRAARDTQAAAQRILDAVTAPA